VEWLKVQALSSSPSTAKKKKKKKIDTRQIRMVRKEIRES
jgi:hypothetical protein